LLQSLYILAEDLSDCEICPVDGTEAVRRRRQVGESRLSIVAGGLGSHDSWVSLQD